MYKDLKSIASDIVLILLVAFIAANTLPLKPAAAAPPFLPVTGGDLSEVASVSESPTAGTKCPVVSYKVKLPEPSCFLGWCVVYAWVPVNGTTKRLVRIRGWNLREGQYYSGTYTACNYR